MLILHAYSAANLGDGLLVSESIAAVREAFGADAAITVCASYPASFDIPDVKFVDAKPNRTGYRREYIRMLFRVNSFDVLIGVGGGYLRAGSFLEATKVLLVHGPQLLTAVISKKSVAYLPQSVGPLRGGSGPLIRAILRRAKVVYLRDDRSMQELDIANAVRTSDMAILTADVSSTRDSNTAPDVVPVLSVRPIGGEVPPLVQSLAHSLKKFDGYVQSDAGANRDRTTMVELGPRAILSQVELLGHGPDGERRVVVAVRLHAALMALRAGHLVIHLAYERKGFGAFQDLGLQEYVHNVNMFEPARVQEQVRTLVESVDARSRYDAAVVQTFTEASVSYRALIKTLSCLATDCERG